MKQVNSYISGLAAILLLMTGCNRAEPPAKSGRMSRRPGRKAQKTLRRSRPTWRRTVRIRVR